MVVDDGSDSGSPPSSGAASVGNGTEAKTDQNEVFSLRVKEEFILKQRDPSLPALPLADEEARPSDRGDDGHRNDGKKSKKGNKKKRKRVRDRREEDAAKICLSVIRNEECPYGAEACRFSHDLDGYMRTRMPDIAAAGIGCPYYENWGHCPFGAMCRLGSAHINSEGANVDKETVVEPPKVMNAIRRDVQDRLRKKTYPFKCQRFDEKKKARDDNIGENNVPESASTEVEASAAEVSTSSSYGPLPAKERKLIDFSNKVYVAPLTTVGNLPFRRILKGMGADITCGEMALCSQLLEGRSSEWALLKRHPSEDVFGVQLAAGYPDLYTRACEVIEAEADVDFVDLNLGCPIDLVCKRGAGASLMLRPKQLRGSLVGISQTLSCPVTVKMRTGWDSAKPLAHSLVPKIVNGWGLPSDSVAAVMVHGRSRLQRYSSTADWDYVAQVANESSAFRHESDASASLSEIPIIGNGDIFSYADYEEKVLSRPELSTCAMLGRGALIKPWLPTEIKERRHWDISGTERLDILKDFVRFGLEHWGSDQQGVNNCRRFLLEWMSFLYRYVPVGMMEILPQQMNHRPPEFMRGRSDLETLFLSNQSSDWIKISEMLLGKVPDGFRFEPKHKAKSYQTEG